MEGIPKLYLFNIVTLLIYIIIVISLSRFGVMMIRIVSVSTALSLVLLSSSSLPLLSVPKHVEFAEQLARPRSPIHVVMHKGEEKIAVNHKKIIGAEALHKQGLTGKGSKVIVIEGVFDPTHDDYTENLTQSTLVAANASRGMLTDYIIEPINKYYVGDHAAHVTGTIAGKGGIAPRAAIRVIDYVKEAFVPDGKEEVSAARSIAKALQIAAQTSGDIVNLSQALVLKSFHKTHPISEETREAMIQVAQSGKIIVMAAGNEKINLGDDVYTRSLIDLAASPEMQGRLLLVGAIDYPKLRERIEGYSDKAGAAKNFYVVAPGSSIDGPNSYNRRIILDGTSMAAPQVSGALALLTAEIPGLQPEEYVDLLCRSARQESLNGSYVFSPDTYGHGAINVQAAVELAKKEGKGNQNLPKPTKAQEKSSAPVPTSPKPSFFATMKNAVTGTGHYLFSAVQNAGSAVKNGISRVFSWSR